MSIDFQGRFDRQWLKCMHIAKTLSRASRLAGRVEFEDVRGGASGFLPLDPAFFDNTFHRYSS